jgi:hypothetical protein
VAVFDFAQKSFKRFGYAALLCVRPLAFRQVPPLIVGSAECRGHSPESSLSWTEAQSASAHQAAAAITREQLFG